MEEKELYKKIENHEMRIKQLEEEMSEVMQKIGSFTPSDFGKNKRPSKSLREFLNEKKPKKDTDITLCIGYYLQEFEKLEFFTSRDIRNGYKRAKIRVPKNISDKIQLNVKRGFMDEYHQEKGIKYWYITETGKKYVDQMSGEK